jgi:hypothetical protein
MKRDHAWYSNLALWLAIPSLVGMAYCHIEDVGMKFHEHVYYMAGLFCCNIAVSILLIPALITAYATGSVKWVRRLWIATGTLAFLTILGFVWSRTVGLPQLEDHIGEWEPLGILSLGFETALVVVAADVLRAARRRIVTERMAFHLSASAAPGARA